MFCPYRGSMKEDSDGGVRASSVLACIVINHVLQSVRWLPVWSPVGRGASLLTFTWWLARCAAAL